MNRFVVTLIAACMAVSVPAMAEDAVVEMTTEVVVEETVTEPCYDVNDMGEQVEIECSFEVDAEAEAMHDADHDDHAEEPVVE
jgi:hypothetical protein